MLEVRWIVGTKKRGEPFGPPSLLDVEGDQYPQEHGKDDKSYQRHRIAVVYHQSLPLPLKNSSAIQQTSRIANPITNITATSTSSSPYMMLPYLGVAGGGRVPPPCLVFTDCRRVNGGPSWPASPPSSLV